VVSVDHVGGQLNNYVGSVANTWDYCKWFRYEGVNGCQGNTGTKICTGSSVAYGQQYFASDVVGVLCDLVKNELTFYR
jgi:hypothetical protein